LKFPEIKRINKLISFLFIKTSYSNPQITVSFINFVFFCVLSFSEENTLKRKNEESHELFSWFVYFLPLIYDYLEKNCLKIKNVCTFIPAISIKTI